jgi:hypothetical protein
VCADQLVTFAFIQERGSLLFAFALTGQPNAVAVFAFSHETNFVFFLATSLLMICGSNVASQCLAQMAFIIRVC